MPLLSQLSSDSLKDTPWTLLHLWQYNQDMLPRLAVRYILPLVFELVFEWQETGWHEGTVSQLDVVDGGARRIKPVRP